MINIFIGYDSKEKVAYNVLSHSIIQNSTKPVAITPIALNNLKDYEVVSWYSKKRDAGGKVRPLFTYGINSGICRDFQVLLYIEKKARHKTFTACKSIGQLDWNFNYWDWVGAEEYLN